MYTNLIAGAIGMSLPAFLAGLVPASVIWLALVTGLCYVLGRWAAAYVHQAEAFALAVVVQLLLAAGLMYGLRRLRPPWADPASPAQLAMAAALDLAVVSVIAATLRLIIGPGGIGVAVAVMVSALVYALAARAVVGSTAGAATSQLLSDAS